MGVFNWLFGVVAGAVTKREYGRDEWAPPPAPQPPPPDVQKQPDKK